MINLIALLFISQPLKYQAPVIEEIHALEAPRVVPPESLETAFKRVFGDDSEIMSAISFCESSHRQFDKNGESLQGLEVKADTGLFQINKSYHLEKSIELGFNIETLEGNLQMAKYLHNKFGTQPWKASKPCWSRLMET